MTDLFGQVAERPAFKDIRNQRESVAEEKARMCQELNTLLRATPKSLGTASIQKVREFKVEHKRCLKVLQAKTSSRQELESAINSMKGWRPHDIPSNHRLWLGCDCCRSHRVVLLSQRRSRNGRILRCNI